MPRGASRTAVIATAFLLLGVAWATAEAPQHVLPAGTAVVFIADGHVDAGARTGSTVAVHLRDPLVLDGVTLAPAGTKARLVVDGSTTRAGRREMLISLDRFSINAGTLPVRVSVPDLTAIDPGTTIDAKTQAVVEHLGDRYSIRIPFPFPLSGDKPAAYYTPTPARTAPPHPFNRPSSAPTPPASAVPSPASGPTKIP